MQCIRKINNDLTWIGANDRQLALFENVYPIPRGVSYNSYLLTDEKTVLLDTADAAVGQQFFENLEQALQGRKLDYLVVHHMEPDHCALIEGLLLRHPEVRIVTNSKAATMIRQFFDFDLDSRLETVSEGDVLNTGKHVTPLLNELLRPSRDGNTVYDLTSSLTAMSTLTGPPSKANSQNLRLTSPPRVRRASGDFSQWL